MALYTGEHDDCPLDVPHAHPGTTETAYDAAIAYARDRGAEDGRNAAGWYARVPDDMDETTARRILRGIEDGDPAVLDTFPYPDLSGEWADETNGPGLVRDALHETGFMRYGEDRPELDTWFSDICDAYETAFSEAVESAIADAARAILA